MKKLERTNAIMIHPNQWAVFAPQCNLYAMDVDRNNRNCYNCGSFRHLVRNCKKRGTKDRIGKEEDWNIGVRTMDKKI